MPAVTAIRKYNQEEKDALQQWADEVGIRMSDLVDQILAPIDAEVERRAARRAPKKPGRNILPFGPLR